MNPEQSIIFHLAHLNKVICQKANALFQESGYRIRIEQVPVLMTLYYQGRLSQQELADLLHRDKSSIQRTIVTLAKAQVVTINEDCQDKRKNIIALSDCGRLLAIELEKNRNDVESHLFKHIGDNAKQKLINLIQDMDIKNTRFRY